MKIKDHMDITNYAVDLYWMFSPTELADKLKTNVDKIQEGTRLVQNGTLEHGTRTFHFFNHKDRLQPKKVKLFGLIPLYTLYPSAEHVLRNYINELKEEISKGISFNVYILMGKILHLVQDMSSPANVVPIYHSKKRSDSFEAILNARMGMYLSNFNINQERFNRVCEPTSNDHCIENIYRHAALTTLGHIQKSNSEFRVEINGESREAGWDLFWEYDDRSDTDCGERRQAEFEGFGRYGPLGRHFGQEQVEVSKNMYVVNKDIYDDLCNYVVRKSVEDSLRILVCIESQLKQSLV